MAYITVLLLIFIAIASVICFPRTFTNSHIVGGETAKLIPYQASVELFDEHFCGGTIISHWFVLTAGHCIMEVSPEDYSVRVGSNIRQNGGQKITVLDYGVHAKFDINTMNYDVAVLQLKYRINYSSKVKPLAMVKKTVQHGTDAVISGWGYEEEDADKIPTKLKFAVVPVVDKKLCEKYIYYLTETMMCAGFVNGTADACNRDSGGPLMANGKLIGIISAGIGCARDNLYGVYTDITKVRLWINNTKNKLKLKHPR